jgi:hypothetical protein
VPDSFNHTTKQNNRNVVLSFIFSTGQAKTLPGRKEKKIPATVPVFFLI